MSAASTVPDINGKVTVAVPIERAFEVFTAKFGTWWPSDYHIGKVDIANAILEPKVGGRWYERGVDGSECDWGTVLEWEPPARLVVTWQINGHWQYDPDPANASEIEVRFIADGAEQTTVEIEHRLLDRLVEGAAMRAAVAGDGGWSGVLQAFAAAAIKQD